MLNHPAAQASWYLLLETFLCSCVSMQIVWQSWCVCFAKWCHIADIILPPAFSLISVSEGKLCYAFNYSVIFNGTNSVPFLWSLPCWRQLGFFFFFFFLRGGVCYKPYCIKHPYTCLAHMQIFFQLLRSRMAWPQGIHSSDLNAYHQGFSKVTGPGPAPTSSLCFSVTASCHIVIMPGCNISADLMGRR